jgi:carbamoyl-phosphate synthase large subunit
MGFSDARLGALPAKEARSAARHALGVRPVYKRIDTCAAEFASPTAYMYSTYENPFGTERLACEAQPSRPQEGRDPRRRPEPDRPGHRVRLLLLPRRLRAEDAGYETIMVNCNPETVSTDYDTSDRLYFEPLTAKTCWRS